MSLNFFVFVHVSWPLWKPACREIAVKYLIFFFFQCTFKSASHQLLHFSKEINLVPQSEGCVRILSVNLVGKSYINLIDQKGVTKGWNILQRHMLMVLHQRPRPAALQEGSIKLLRWWKRSRAAAWNSETGWQRCHLFIYFQNKASREGPQHF